MKLRLFNEKGVHEFGLQIDEIRQGLRKELDPVILNNEDFTRPFENDIELELQIFASKKEISIYLVDKLNLLANKQLYYNSFLWSWITAYYFDIVCPPKANGSRKVNEIAKYILSDPKNWRKYYRHLLACSARLYCELGDLADAFLASPIHLWGDFHEQLTAYQSIATNRPLIQSATSLYWDTQEVKLKRGSGSKGAGTPRRFSDIIGQFELTFDLNAMRSSDILALLPTAEFKKWA